MSLLSSFTKPKATQTTVPIAMDHLVPDPDNERKTFANMDGLIASIRHMGIIEPPVVKPLPHGRYQLLTGHRRWAAAKHLGHETLDVVIRHDNTDDRCDVRIKSLISNLQREAVPPLELAETLQGLLDDPNGIETQRQLAAYLGKAESWISDTLALLRLAPQLQSKLRKSEKKISLDAISKIARLDDLEQQEHLLDQALMGAPTTTIREQIQQSTHPSDKDSSHRPKPKVSYHTGHQAVLIIQSQDSHDLTPERQRAVLQEAFQQIPEAA
jgi:ParB family chromosome partitioning protein